MFFLVNLVTERFGYYVSRMPCCYYTLFTSLICCFFAEIFFSLLKIAYLSLKEYRRK
ncbi:hypothetical protein ACSXB8_02230 [Clostridium perfringens]